ncbi:MULTISPECIES: 23S rRNA pseudouridine(1911/1915/1917) synthase RluD [Nitrosomonas]|uniref:Ribosomal large subunit pseudouridine synthase D n=1 Tax=Nitrosomonas europaea (strain ATCC 19718 / CIP 103999 / KCTC 2705 / NBRC 14298) TaxID=228410 RepID=RLUD_NITEU|nr:MULTISPECIES: 23S rRNA pseudouridine(1911/1915/1917) synthase RluD [Nitrosomonas]Q82WZ5.1 RecName: Full=Ribosomal large subunit pseudouridine synthase D; AltName: Full=23S rRNA pseudouridine(1911/1915/1917) synthase; AltName: Full=rRNA pseudouridylate synthase D; AltName: Full=rRNA-uridine isomerase D [Nitrosomonas europaea ATCC 19718]CAD84416.1 rluD; ribosomal large subunit pseudouridine synthase D [Nitrosomonas europaea ATCC 19718]HBF24618.1 23S rRNA pseudouridine(1911/1915/1917) synthase R
MMNRLINEQDGRNYSAKPDSSAAGSQENENTIELTVPDNLAGLRLDQALAQLLPQWSRSRLQGWIEQKCVSVDSAAATCKQKVWGGESIRVIAGQTENDQSHQAEAIPLKILFEDDHLIIIDKPAGLVVHPGNGNWHGTLLNALLNHAPQLSQVPRAGIVHRLDKDTTGLLVVAKTIEAQFDLARQLQQRTVKRHYLALVLGKLEKDGVVDAPIGRHPIHRTRMAVVQNGKPARTHYRVLEKFTASTLLHCSLETGRTHQIRVHLLSIGHPLAGDPVYGRTSPDPSTADAVVRLPRQALHAWQLELTHPHSGQILLWESPLPDDMAALLQAIRNLPHSSVSRPL